MAHYSSNNRKVPDLQVEKKPQQNQVEDGIAEGLFWTFRIARYLYLVLAIIGVFFYYAQNAKGLYICTGVALAAYILQWLTHTVVFWSGIFLLPLGGVFGYVFLHTLPGACLGIMVVFILRHLGRDILWNLVRKLVIWGNS